MPPAFAYLFLELAMIVFFVGFGWGQFQFGQLQPKRLWRSAAILGTVWLVADLAAVRLGLWSFPPGRTLPMRLIGLPIEEYILFVLHTIICVLLIAQTRLSRK
jgi:lycopene cyclase domain-containing protein